MNLFSETFLSALVITALVWTGLAALTLLILLIKDYKDKNIW